MPIQLTPEQEQRLTAVVSAGAYTSTEDALNAALTVVEKTAAHGFEGSMDDLEPLLLEGINSGQPTVVDEAFWQRLTVQTDQLLEEHQGRKSGS